MNDCSTLARRIVPRDCDVFVGIDVDKRSIAVTYLDHLGLSKSLKMPNDSSLLLSWVRRHLGAKRVVFAYEAGPTGFGLHDAIVGSGYTCLVVAPSCVPRARGRRVRTNRLDSRKLAYQLRGGSLEGIRVPDERYRQLRELVNLRKMYKDDAAAAKQRIKALFLRNGLDFAWNTPGGSWSRRVINELRWFDGCSKPVKFKLNSLLDSLEFGRYQAVAAQRSIRELVESGEELSESVRLAMSIPGIGWIVASYAVARIGSWRLMGTSAETGSFFGLTPSEDSTGEGSDRGSITKAGDPVMRSMLIEGAWTAIRKDPELKEFYERVHATHARHLASRVAIVAVARKLTARLHCVLKERREYEVRSRAQALAVAQVAVVSPATERYQSWEGLDDVENA